MRIPFHINIPYFFIWGLFVQKTSDALFLNRALEVKKSIKMLFQISVIYFRVLEVAALWDHPEREQLFKTFGSWDIKRTDEISHKVFI